MKKGKPEPDDAEQSARFVEKAKELEADKNVKAFEKAIGLVVPPHTNESRKRPKE